MEFINQVVATTVAIPSINSDIEWKHQQIAVAKAKEHFSDTANNRANLIMCCGSGKSKTSLIILEQLRKLNAVRHTIITVPNLILQGQMYREFHGELSKTHKFICIGSDKEVKGEDACSESIVTTDSKEIAAFLLANETKEYIILSTYQSLVTLAEVCKGLNLEIDFAIIDESHRTIGSRDKSFSNILFDDKIKVKRRLFMTATKKIYKGRIDEVIGMDNEEYYGKTIYNYSLRQAITDGILCDYDIAYPFSTSQDVYDFISDNPYIGYDKIELAEKEKQNLICSLLATISAIRDKGCRKIISYHNTIKKAKIFKQLLDKVISNNLLKIGTFHINGNQNGKERFGSMKHFQNAFVGVLTNAKALVEGVNIPSVDCIVFADKCNSPVNIIQAVGRAVRKYEGKLKSYVIIPILIKSENDTNVENGEFKKLFEVLMALAIMDKTAMHEIRDLSIGNSCLKTKNSKLEFSIKMSNVFREKVAAIIGEINLRIYDKFNNNLKSMEEHLAFGVENNLTHYALWANHKRPKGFYSCPDKIFVDFFCKVRELCGKPDIEFKSKEEHIQYAIENKILNYGQWIKAKTPYGFLRAVNRRFGNLFFEEVCERIAEITGIKPITSGIKKDKNCHIELAILNKISTPIQWIRLLKTRNDRVLFYRTPNIRFGDSFFEEVCQKMNIKKRKSLEENLNFAVNNKLYTKNKWEQYKKPDGYLIQPAVKKIEGVKFFEKVKEILRIDNILKANITEHIQFAVENKLTSITKWQKFIIPIHFYKDPSSEYGCNYFFNEVKRELAMPCVDRSIKRKNEQEHINFAIKNKLTSCPLWVKFNKPDGYYQNPNIKFPSFFVNVRNFLDIPLRKGVECKKIKRYDLNGDYVDTLDSIKVACQMVGLSRPTIARCCKGLNKSAGGYIWKYA